jgi:hypothetical protein
MTRKKSSLGKYTQQRSVDNRRVRRQISHESSRQFALMMLLGFFMVLGLTLNGWVRWKQTEITYRINQVHSETNRLTELKNRILTQLAEGKSLYKAAAIAKEMGLENIKPEQIIRVTGGDR